jgi:DNA gyrase subunit A
MLAFTPMENPNISPVNIEDEMRQSFMDYAMSVIISRALPDVRDGLKPVQRRVLFAMQQEGLASNRKHSKCAAVVGAVMKSLHPHGDAPIYETLVRLAQPWNMRYMLVNGQGNFGDVDGDPAAAPRYTECRMTSLSEALLEDLNKETVDFQLNYDETTTEPIVLPASVPNLLINGADGIAVGMATHMPPHNLGEVITAVIAYLEDPTISLQKLMTIVPGPDFPTGGTIYGRSAIAQAYSTGRGIIQIRAKTHFEMLKGKSREIEAIVITEIPFQVNKARLVERIAQLWREKAIEGISDLRDETDRSGMRIVVELKRDATKEVVLNQLYKLTQMQDSYGIINLAIVDGKPVVCSLPELIKHFVAHRRDVVFRRTQFELKSSQERMHLLEGFRIALLNLDKIIATIREAQTPPEAKTNLISRFELSPIQAQAILDMRLQKLTGMERLAVENEHAELKAEIERLLGVLADGKKIDAIIITELQNVREKFQDPRRTQLAEEVDEILVEDLIEDQEMVVTVSHQGYAKRVAASEYRAQKRGGKGVTGAVVKDEDFVEQMFVASSLSSLLVFTTLGRAFLLKVYEIPEAGRTARGRALVNLLQLKDGEQVSALLPVKEFTEGVSIVMATKLGVIKRCSMMDFANTRRSGIIACGLEDNDSLIGVALSDGKSDILLECRSGKSIRFSEEDVRIMGRSARGVTGMKLDKDDHLASMTVVAAGNIAESDESDDNKGSEEELVGVSGQMLLTVCEHGYGKRTPLNVYRVQGRGGKGIIDIQTEGRNGPVVGAFVVEEGDEAMMVTSTGKIVRTKVKDISPRGRNTMGVRLINLDSGERVVAVSRIPESTDVTSDE